MKDLHFIVNDIDKEYFKKATGIEGYEEVSIFAKNKEGESYFVGYICFHEEEMIMKISNDKIDFPIQIQRSTIENIKKEDIKEVVEEIKPYIYPSGFKVGDRAIVISHSRKYNYHITIDIGTEVVIIDPPDKDWPEDAVEIEISQGNMFKGTGSVDANSIRKI